MQTILNKPKHPAPALAPVTIIDPHLLYINLVAKELREQAGNLRYTFQDESTYKSLTDYFVIKLVLMSIPLVGKNMHHIHVHVLSIIKGQP